MVEGDVRDSARLAQGANQNAGVRKPNRPSRSPAAADAIGKWTSGGGTWRRSRPIRRNLMNEQRFLPPRAARDRVVNKTQEDPRRANVGVRVIRRPQCSLASSNESTVHEGDSGQPPGKGIYEEESEGTVIEEILRGPQPRKGTPSSSSVRRPARGQSKPRSWQGLTSRLFVSRSVCAAVLIDSVWDRSRP